MKQIWIITLALGALLLTACDKKQSTNTSTSGIAKIACDESFRNILDQEVEVFEYSYPDASIMPAYMDEAAALDSLLHQKVDLIITSRDLTDAQLKATDDSPESGMNSPVKP